MNGLRKHSIDFLEAYKLKQDRKQRYGRWLFVAIALLILVQVGWWTTVFFQDVEIIADLKREVVLRSSNIHPDFGEAEIQKDSFHRRLMFASESITFMGVVCLGLYLLYRALRSERLSRLTQRNFIETVSHESKTPLTALKLRLESIEERWGVDPELRAELDSAKAQIRRLSSLMDKALYLNRVERDVFQFEPISLADAVEEVLKRMDPLLRERKVAVHTKLDRDLWVQGDIFAIQTSIQSLIENSVFYNESEQKQIWISLSVENERAVFDIVDNGVGISDKDRPFVFERFYRGTGNSRIPGTGLGLYLAKTIVEAHQGTLQILSSTKGNGANFELRLPLLKGGIA